MLTASLLQHNLMQIHFSPGWHFVTQLQPGPGAGAGAGDCNNC